MALRCQEKRSSHPYAPSAVGGRSGTDERPVAHGPLEEVFLPPRRPASGADGPGAVLDRYPTEPAEPPGPDSSDEPSSGKESSGKESSGKSSFAARRRLGTESVPHEISWSSSGSEDACELEGGSGPTNEYRAPVWAIVDGRPPAEASHEQPTPNPAGRALESLHSGPFAAQPGESTPGLETATEAEQADAAGVSDTETEGPTFEIHRPDFVDDEIQDIIDDWDVIMAQAEAAFEPMVTVLPQPSPEIQAELEHRQDLLRIAERNLAQISAGKEYTVDLDLLTPEAYADLERQLAAAKADEQERKNTAEDAREKAAAEERVRTTTD